MKSEDVFYSPTEEDCFDNLEDALRFIEVVTSSKKDALGWVIDINKKIKPSHSRVIDGNYIIEKISELAKDEWGEYAEDYLSEIYLNKEKCKEFENLIFEWINKNAELPKFYESGGVVDCVIVDEEILEKYNIDFD